MRITVIQLFQGIQHSVRINLPAPCTGLEIRVHSTACHIAGTFFRILMRCRAVAGIIGECVEVHGSFLQDLPVFFCDEGRIHVHGREYFLCPGRIFTAHLYIGAEIIDQTVFLL